ncbi:hypothetical protein COOONC_01397 [Cooperia oncophora]
MFRESFLEPQIIPVNKAKLLEKFTKEVRRLSPPKKGSMFRERVRTALDIMQTKRHKCRDLPLMWNQSQALLHSSIVEPAQGQWLICGKNKEKQTMITTFFLLMIEVA